MEQEKPDYPFTSVQIAPQGMLITIMFSQTIGMNVVLDNNTCNEIVRLWITQRKMGDQAMRVVKSIKDGKGTIA